MLKNDSPAGNKFRFALIAVGAIGFTITTLFSFKFGGEAFGGNGEPFFILNGHAAGVFFNFAQFLFLAIAGWIKEPKIKWITFSFGIFCSIVSISASIGSMQNASSEGLYKDTVFQNLQSLIDDRDQFQGNYNDQHSAQLSVDYITDGKKTLQNAENNINMRNENIDKQITFINSGQSNIGMSASFYVGLSKLTGVSAQDISTRFSIFLAILLEAVTGYCFFLAGYLLSKMFYENTGYEFEHDRGKIDEMLKKKFAKEYGGNGNGNGQSSVVQSSSSDVRPSPAPRLVVKDSVGADTKYKADDSILYCWDKLEIRNMAEIGREVKRTRETVRQCLLRYKRIKPKKNSKIKKVFQFA